MPHAPVTRPTRGGRGRVPRHRCSRPAAGVVRDLRDTIAAAHGVDLADLGADPGARVRPAGCLHLLGAGSPAPLESAGEVLARVDELAHELVEHMRSRGWAEAAAPEAVTSVLAASVPPAEAVLLRAARSRRR
jgi:hypothetical protein